eukprot:jgi/Bigna1/146231/aug1.111_g20939
MEETLPPLHRLSTVKALEQSAVEGDLEAFGTLPRLPGGKLRETSELSKYNCVFCFISPLFIIASLPFCLWGWICRMLGISYLMEGLLGLESCALCCCCTEATYAPCIFYYSCCCCHYIDELESCPIVPRELKVRMGLLDGDDDVGSMSGYQSAEFLEGETFLGANDRPYTTM